MKEVKDYSPSKDARLINCKTECGNERCFAKRYGLFAEKTCHNFVEPKLITNADRIRGMTDEELAHLLHSAEEHLFTGNLWNYEKWTEWLKQEASE